jgi:hypothetical protein
MGIAAQLTRTKVDSKKSSLIHLPFRREKETKYRTSKEEKVSYQIKSKKLENLELRSRKDDRSLHW